MSVGGIVGGVVDSIFGGGSSSSGSSTGGGDAWITTSMAANSYGSRTADAQDRQVTWQSVLAGIVGTYGVIRNYELQKRMVDLHQRSVDQAEEYLTLAKRHYDEIAVPTFDRVRDHFDFVRDNWRPKLTLYIDEGLRLKEYTPDYTSQMGRFMSVAQAEMDKARRMRTRMQSRFETGRACYEDALFAIRGAELRTAAASAGYRYEDAKKIEMDKWFWQRWSNVAELVSSAIANAISGLNQSTAVATTSLSQIGGAVGRGRDALAGLSGATESLAGFWGTQANSSIRGYYANQGRELMATGIPVSNTVSPSTMASITGTPANSITNLSGGTMIGPVGSTAVISNRNKGASPT